MQAGGVQSVGEGIVQSWFTAGGDAGGYAFCAAGARDVSLQTAVAALTAIDAGISTTASMSSLFRAW